MAIIKKNLKEDKKKDSISFTIDQSLFHKEIELKAHDLYLKRLNTNAPGDHLSDWLIAESDIKRKYKIL